MIRVIKTLMAAMMAVVCVQPAAAQVLIGAPVVNPANGHIYYRLYGSNNLSLLRFTAQSQLNGNLVTINDAAENLWVYNTFVAGGQFDYYIGYSDFAGEGQWLWDNSEASTFTAWDAGEPNDAGGGEDYASMVSRGPVWNDLPDFGGNIFGGIVEVEDNQTCAGAREMFVPGAVIDSPAENFGGGSPCPGTFRNTVWFTFADNGTAVTATTCEGFPAPFDTMIYAFSGECGALSCVGSNDNAGCGFQGTGSSLTFFAHQGERYFITVQPVGSAWDLHMQFMLVLQSTPHSVPAVASGPHHNPANGHAYYVTTPGVWPDQEALAQSMGGHLATISNLAENTFVRTMLGKINQAFIGFTDQVVEGTFEWASGETPGYTRWGSGEPNNQNNEDYTVMRSDGRWNDVMAHWEQPAVIELAADCFGALPLAVPSSISAAYVPDPLDTGEISCGGTGLYGRGVWHRVVGDGSMITAQTCGSVGMNATVRVLTGDCANINCVAGNAGGCALGSTVTFYAELGRTYFVLVGDYFDAGASGTYSLSVSKADAPALTYDARSDVNATDCSRYYAISPSWHPHASAAARHVGMELATIADAADNVFVRSFANSASLGFPWIGLTDLTTPDAFAWLDDSPATYTNWLSGEPNGGAYEYFTEMTGAGQWNDLPYHATAAAVAEARIDAAVGGRIRGAVALHGGDDAVRLPDNTLAWPGADFTIECWFRTTSGGIVFGQTASNGGYVPMLYVGEDGALRAAEWGPSGGEIIHGPVVNNGEWRHLAFTRSGATMTLLVDGAFAGTHFAPNTAYDPNARYSYRIGNGLGAGWPAAPSHDGFIGEIDELRIWNVARSTAQIGAAKDTRYFDPALDPMLALSLDFDDAGGTLAFDGAARRHGRLLGAPRWLYEDRNHDKAVDACQRQCSADIDGNGVVNSTDVSAFINLWFADQASALLNADFNRDGVSNSTDVSDLINEYFAAGPECL